MRRPTAAFAPPDPNEPSPDHGRRRHPGASPPDNRYRTSNLNHDPPFRRARSVHAGRIQLLDHIGRRRRAGRHRLHELRLAQRTVRRNASPRARGASAGAVLDRGKKRQGLARSDLRDRGDQAVEGDARSGRGPDLHPRRLELGALRRGLPSSRGSPTAGHLTLGTGVRRSCLPLLEPQRELHLRPRARPHSRRQPRSRRRRHGRARGRRVPVRLRPYRHGAGPGHRDDHELRNPQLRTGGLLLHGPDNAEQLEHRRREPARERARPPADRRFGHGNERLPAAGASFGTHGNRGARRQRRQRQPDVAGQLLDRGDLRGAVQDLAGIVGDRHAGRGNAHREHDLRHAHGPRGRNPLRVSRRSEEHPRIERERRLVGPDSRRRAANGARRPCRSSPEFEQRAADLDGQRAGRSRLRRPVRDGRPELDHTSASNRHGNRHDHRPDGGYVLDVPGRRAQRAWHGVRRRGDRFHPCPGCSDRARRRGLGDDRRGPHMAGQLLG